MPPNFQILFFGEILAGHDAQYVRQRLQELLKCPDEALRVVFSGERIVLRKGLDAQSAERYLQRLMKMGLAVRVDPPLASLPDAPDTEQANFRPPPGISLPPLSQMPPISDFPPLEPTTTPARTRTGIEIHEAPPTEIPGVLSPEELQPASRTRNRIAEPPATETVSRGMVTCPRCGEVQPRHPICRACQTDMARFTEAHRAQALKLAEPDKPRARTKGAQGNRIIYRDDGSGVIGLDFNGRMGRRAYALAGLWSLNLMLLGGVISLLTTQFVPLVLCTLLTLVYGVRITVLRLHDLGWNGTWALLGLVPGLNLLQGLWLALGAGESEANLWGKPCRPMGMGSFVLGLGLALVCLGGLSYRLGSAIPALDAPDGLHPHLPSLQGLHLPGRAPARLPV